jgi:hypothetical protein
MIALVLAGIVLAGTALVMSQNRRRPKRVRVKAKDRKDPPGR